MLEKSSPSIVRRSTFRISAPNASREGMTVRCGLPVVPDDSENMEELLPRWLRTDINGKNQSMASDLTRFRVRFSSAEGCGFKRRRSLQLSLRIKRPGWHHRHSTS